MAMVSVHQLWGHTYILILLLLVLIYIGYFCITNLHADFELPFVSDDAQTSTITVEPKAVTYVANPVLHVSN